MRASALKAAASVVLLTIALHGGQPALAALTCTIDGVVYVATITGSAVIPGTAGNDCETVSGIP